MATASVSATAGLPAGIAPAELQRISLEIYREMIDLGLILPTDRVELLDGFLVKKMPKYPRHASVTRRLAAFFEARLPRGGITIKEDPIELPAPLEGDSSPEPDVTIVTGTPEDYERRHPGPGDIVLVVEVAGDARMLVRDRAGLERYARAGLPMVWIVNLADDTVEIYTKPSGMVANPEYGACEVKGVGDVAEVTLGGTVVAIAVADIVK